MILMTTFNSENADWDSWAKEEHSLEEYLQKFDIKLTREKIEGKVKQIMVTSYLQDIATRMNYEVI
jgi:hypothetical protein